MSMRDKQKPAVIMPMETNLDKAGSVVYFNSDAKLAPYDHDDSYNPFEHRAVQETTTTMGALLHLLKSSLGTGIMAMPNAFNNAGVLFGTIMTLVVAVLCTHCVWILVSTSHKICKISRTPLLTFAGTAEKVFEYGSPWARRNARAAGIIVDYALMATYFSAGCIYIVFVGNTLHDVFNQLFGWTLGVRIYIVIGMVPILLIGQIRTLKFLVPFSGSANVFIVIVFGIVLYYIFKEPLTISDKPLVAPWTQWPVFFSTVILAMEGIGSIMPVENTMDKPQHFLGKPRILLIAMSFVTVLYTVTGLLGYIRFGDEIRGSITLNLPTDEWTAVTGQLLIALSILFTFGLQFFVPMDILLRKIEHKIEGSRNIKEIVLRTVIMIAMGGLAIAIPDLGPFISLVGAVFFVSLGLLVPTIIETVFCQSNGGFGHYNWILWKNILLIALSLVAVFSGALVSIIDIVNLYTEDDELATTTIAPVA